MGKIPWLVYAGGLRVSELVNLRKDDILID